MVFSNENINRLRERKVAMQPQSVVQDSLSKMKTMMSMTEAINNADIQNAEHVNHWFFGVQVKAYPYNLLMLVVECLEEMGFVFIL